jgi:hypothetical protein
MTTPVQRISRLLNEGARFMVQIPGQVSIDLTPDVIAAMAGVQMGSNTHEESRNLLTVNDLRRDVATFVEFT